MKLRLSIFMRKHTFLSINWLINNSEFSNNIYLPDDDKVCNLMSMRVIFNICDFLN